MNLLALALMSTMTVGGTDKHPPHVCIVNNVMFLSDSERPLFVEGVGIPLMRFDYNGNRIGCAIDCDHCNPDIEVSFASWHGPLAEEDQETGDMDPGDFLPWAHNLYLGDDVTVVGQIQGIGMPNLFNTKGWCTEFVLICVQRLGCLPTVEVHASYEGPDIDGDLMISWSPTVFTTCSGVGNNDVIPSPNQYLTDEGQFWSIQGLSGDDGAGYVDCGCWDYRTGIIFYVPSVGPLTAIGDIKVSIGCSECFAEEMFM